MSQSQLESIVGEIVNAVEQRDLLPLLNLCVDKPKLEQLLEENTNDPNLNQKNINSVYAAAGAIRKQLKTVHALLENENDTLAPSYWAWRELGRKIAVVNETEVFFKKGYRTLVIAFETIVLDDQNYLFRSFELTEILAPIERYLTRESENYAGFKAATQWPDNQIQPAEASQLNELITHYQKVSIEFDEGESPIKSVTQKELQPLAKIEKIIGRAFPPELVEWWQAGSISEIRSWSWGYSISIYTPSEMQEIMEDQQLTHSVKKMGMAEVLDYYHSGEFKESLSPDDYELLNDKYTIVGSYRLNDSDALYIYSDEDNRFGLIEYNHEWRHYSGIRWNAEYRLLHSKSRANSSLTDLVVQLIELSAYELWQASE